jgi:hypothetical protein
MVTIAAAPVALKDLSFADFMDIYGYYKPTWPGINFHFQLKDHRQTARWPFGDFVWGRVPFGFSLLGAETIRGTFLRKLPNAGH